MRTPLIDIKTFKQRRARLSEKAKGSAVIIASHPEYIRNSDVHHYYRPDSYLFYLTGFEEPESGLVFRPGCNPETVMFVREKNLERETWDGFRFGPDLAQREFGLDKCYPISEFEKIAADLLDNVDKVYYRLNWNEEFDERFFATLEKSRLKKGRSGRGYPPIFDPHEVLSDLRLFKTDDEIPFIKKACSISAQAHVEAMRFAKPGITERQLWGVILNSMLQQGAAREAYPAIVASGANATTLHYVFNDQECKVGDLLLVDAGAEYNYYAGDITRGYPVSGKFTRPQTAIYEAVLNIQKQILAMIRPGIPFKSLQDKTIELSVQALLDLGFLKGKPNEIIEQKTYQKYYPHGVSHFLGMDVHDVGYYTVDNESRKIEKGMVFTVEPGLYISLGDTNVPSEFRGIGVRIEDDILVTDVGIENLTLEAPKEINELEAIVGKKGG